MDMPLARNVVLIDFENMQPPSLKELAAPGFTVLVFVGASQARISMDVAEAMQGLAARGVSPSAAERWRTCVARSENGAARMRG